MIKKIIITSSLIALSILQVSVLYSQTVYPEPFVDQSYVAPAPDAQAFESYGNTPVTLYEGLPGVGIPIYQMKCGSISLPISISYNYNGLFPLQDASWVGLGWNLDAGGTITRIIGGYVDSSQNNGYNYGQYNINDTLFTAYNYNNFLQNAYDDSLSYAHKSYDLVPDIYDAEFSGGSGKFFWYNGKEYQLSYDKQLGVSWPSVNSNITITTTDGTAYTFGARDTTTCNVYGGPAYAPLVYYSAWHLTMVVSADKKDTITLSYTPYTWQQYSASGQNSYAVSGGVQPDLGADPTSFFMTPSIHVQVLQSIRCRSARVSFIPSSNNRNDIPLLSIPSLGEIDIIDSLTGTTVKKNKFYYEYFGQVASNQNKFERLKLKKFTSVNTQLTGDSLMYTFKYLHEYDSFPSKATLGVDYWGYYNGKDSNASLIIPSTSIYYSPPAPSGSSFGTGNNRIPNFTYCSYGALDTIVYPAGGYTVFQYNQNNFLNVGDTNSLGPGIRVQSVLNYDGYASSPVLQKNYTYLADDGVSSSGTMANPPYLYGTPFSANDGTNNYSYWLYKAPNNGPGVGGASPMFYYQKVTESIASGIETHKSDHYFTRFSGLYLDVRQTSQIDYKNILNTNLFTPLRKSLSSYTTVSDTLFIAAYPNIASETYNAHQHPPITYTYTYGFTYSNYNTYWTHPTSQQTTEYDTNGDSIVNTVNFTFNPTTRNLTSIQRDNSDGQTVLQKFKYPEDYTSGVTGNMVTSHVLSPVIENEIWMKKDATDSLLISGSVTSYDQTIFKPTSVYILETTTPITALNNETKTGSLYNTLQSDSRYIPRQQLQYDGNDNPSTVNKSSDVNISYIWDYRHANPIAQVSNASQTDISYTSFEADGKGNWTFTGSTTADTTSPTGISCYNIGQASGSITKSSLTSGTNYIVSYWLKQNTSLSITGTVAGYPIQGKTINGWTYFEHKITGQTTITVSGTGTIYIDELRLYPYTAQMSTFTYSPLIGKTTQCDADNRITYYQYDGFGRLKVVRDQDHNIVKTVQYHYNGETAE